MFSSRLEQRRKVRRFAILVAFTVLVIGIGLIAVVAVQGFDLLGAAEADRMPLGLAVLGALAGLLVLTLVAYAAVRIFSRVD
jgi:energy-converting hydrogenase Eha subunit A